MANCEGVGGISVGLKHLKAAIDSCNEALRYALNDIWALNSKVLCLIGFGDFYRKLDETEKSIDSYKDALAISEQSLSVAEDDLEAHYFKITTLRRLGELYLSLGQELEAKETLRNGVAVCDEAMDIAAGDRDLIREKGRIAELLNNLE